MKTIYLAGGCFWGTQHLMRQLRGVVATRCGYANGQIPDPTYEQVYTDLTGYAETVEVLFNEEEIPLSTILAIFFRSIDPLSLNRQGDDVGTRYRTGIYYDDPTLREDLERLYNSVAELHGTLAVELCPLQNFYPAEEYHQNYLVKNPSGYCHVSPELISEAKQMNKKK